MQALNKAAEVDSSLVIMLLLLFIVFIAIILLFILTHLLPGIIGARVHRTREFGMDFDVVTDMSKKGLLTPEEANRVKSVLARDFSRLRGQLPHSEPAAQAGSIKGPEEQTQDVKTARTAGQIASPPAGGAQRQAKERARDPGVVPVPLDVQDMHQMGMISDEEFEALKRFYAARAHHGK